MRHDQTVIERPMQVSKEEEELIKQRLDVKRGLPLQDLSGNRGFPQ